MDVHIQNGQGRPGVLISSEFAVRKLDSAGNLCPPWQSSDVYRYVHSEAARMPLVPCSSDVSARPKLVVEKRTRRYAFQQRKGLEGRVKRVPK